MLLFELPVLFQSRRKDHCIPFVVSAGRLPYISARFESNACASAFKWGTLLEGGVEVFLVSHRMVELSGTSPSNHPGTRGCSSGQVD